jgi:SpoVK/Ycf46/Vps4 family AAA+-type ATPase
VRDSNDRFANAQTNYLLQRIESYDGIVLLTSNSQTRFDPAFARRLDFTIEFPLPGPEERRALWQSHLGPQTRLQPAELNQLAVLLDLTGGHIRNAVLAAAVCARQAGRPITFGDVLDGVAAELTKLGRHMPVDLLSSR